MDRPAREQFPRWRRDFTASMNAPAAGSFRSAREPQFYALLRQHAAFRMPNSIIRWTTTHGLISSKSLRMYSRPRPRRVVRDHGGHRRCFAPVLTMSEALNIRTWRPKDFRQPPRRHQPRRTTFLAHAVGDPRGRHGGYRKPYKRVEGRAVLSPHSPRKRSACR